MDAHGWVALYCRTNMSIKHRKDLDVVGLEALWGEMFLSDQTALVGVFYKPPSAPRNYWNLVEESIGGAKLTGIGSIFLLGDMNCNMTVPNNILEEIMDNFNMTQLTSRLETAIFPTSCLI